MTGNASPPGSLARRLRRSSCQDLLSLIETHGREMGLREVRQILLNPYCDRRVLEELLLFRSLVANYEIRVALCRHRLTPEPAAMRHVAGLFWRDLLEISCDQRLQPGIRRLAERYLCQRLPRLTVGEKIALARRATPEVAKQLSHDVDLRVLAALFENSRLTPELFLPIALDHKASPRRLAALAEHPRWGRSYEIRAALARNAQAPFRVLFDILPELRLADLEEICQIEEHSSIVRQRAAEVMQTRRPRGVTMPDDGLGV